MLPSTVLTGMNLVMIFMIVLAGFCNVERVSRFFQTKQKRTDCHFYPFFNLACFFIDMQRWILYKQTFSGYYWRRKKDAFSACHVWVVREENMCRTVWEPGLTCSHAKRVFVIICFELVTYWASDHQQSSRVCCFCKITLFLSQHMPGPYWCFIRWPRCLFYDYKNWRGTPPPHLHIRKVSTIMIHHVHFILMIWQGIDSKRKLCTQWSVSCIHVWCI